MALSVMRISSGQTSVQHFVMLHRPMPNSLRSSPARDAPSMGCISRPATRTKKRGPANSSFLSCSRRTWQTFWQRKHSMHLRNSWTRSTSLWSIFHSASGRGWKGGILLLMRKFQETSVTRSLMSGNAFIGKTVTGLSRGRESMRVLQVSRGRPFTSAEHEPHFPALQFQRRSEEHTSELQSRLHIVCRLLLEKKKTHPNTDNHGPEVSLHSQAGPPHVMCYSRC